MTVALTFAEALAKFRWNLMVERNLLINPSDEELDAATEHTSHALRILCAMPATDVSKAIQKLDAVLALYGDTVPCVPLLDTIGELRAQVTVVPRRSSWLDRIIAWFSSCQQGIA